MKCHEKFNLFFGLSSEKTLWIIKINYDETIQIAKKVFYTNQTEVKINSFFFFFLGKEIFNLL